MAKTILVLAILMYLGFSISSASILDVQNGDRDRHIDPAKETEVWIPVPEQITFTQTAIPSDAIVLFDGADTSQLEDGNGEAILWTVDEDILTVTPGAGDIFSKQDFCDVQLHVEWRSPTERYGQSNQHWGNSGIKIQDRYEVQILHSFNNPTYVNGQAASIYKQHPPLVNASLPAGQWQTYDIIYKAPRFEGKVLSSPGYITVLHNGVLVQNHVEIFGTTRNVGQPGYEAHGCAPLRFQEHTAKVSFRKIWVRKL